MRNSDLIVNSKCVLRASDLAGASRYASFRADVHIHSFTAAFGLPQQRFAAFCSEQVEAGFKMRINQSSPVRYYLKLVAMLEDWRKYTHPTSIRLNRKTIFQGDLFLENVCQGWSSVYFEINARDFMDENLVEIRNLAPKDNMLIVERVEILETIMVCDQPDRHVVQKRPLEDILPMYVGMDSDDHRHDESGEMERFLDHFVRTRMGNFVVFCPKSNRNYPGKYPATKRTWLKWIKFCRDHKIFFQYSQNLPLTVSHEEIVRAGGRYFLGYQLHEPYLVFQPLSKATEKIRKAKNLLHKKEAYIEYLSEQLAKMKHRGCAMLYLDPSMLAVYLRETKTDAILAEPVSNASLVFGTARGTGKPFGALIVPDWYLGFPHDDSATRRLSIMLDLTYAYGGQYAIVQNGLFKTNADSRNDWEDHFCQANREVLRRFYKFTCLNPRMGRTQASLALVYGNMESMFWLPDDRCPELIDLNDWDDCVWGKWRDTKSRWVWKASEAWLPPLLFEDLGKNESLTRMFAGTPYGPVDVVSPDVDLTRYKAIAFLGWNSMNGDIYRKLVDYVKAGGILFICGCHFDTRVDLTKKTRMIHDGKVGELIGATIIGPGEIMCEGIRACKLEDLQARQLSRYLFEYQNGKGRVMFFNSYDYPSDPRLIQTIKDILRQIGAAIQSEFGLDGGMRGLVNYNIWTNDKDSLRKILLTNIDWQTPGNCKQVDLRLWNERYPLVVKEGQVRVATVSEKLAVIPFNRMTAVRSISLKKSGQYEVLLTGLCNDADKLQLCWPSSTKLMSLSCGAHKLAYTIAPYANMCTFSVPIGKAGKIVVGLEG